MNMSAELIRKITDRNYILDTVMPRLLSVSNVASLAEDDTIYVPFMDMMTIFYLPVPMNESMEKASVRITRAILRKAGLSTEDILRSARRNLAGQKIEFRPLGDVLDEMTGSDNGDTKLWLLTNSERIYGAAVILDDTVLKQVADQFQDDVIILPSSVHETLVLPYSGMANDLLDLVSMVQSINRTHVRPEEMLADNAYVYHRKDDYMSRVL